MFTRHVSYRNKFHWLLLLPLLLACNFLTEAPEPTPVIETPQAVISPSSMPPATLTPMSEPGPVEPTTSPATAEPQTSTSAVLPAELYYLNKDNQIMRLAADGLTLTQITNEPEPVIAFDISPTYDRLVYISGNKLIESDVDGSNRIVKVEGGPYDPNTPGDFVTKKIDQPHYAPDGSQIAFSLNGINIIASGSATDYQVIIPSDPYPDITNLGANTENPIRFFNSGSWSPDGTKLLVEYSFFPEAGGMAIWNIADGTLTELTNPNQGITCCDWAWSADGSTGYVASNLLAYGSPGLVRFDTTSGQGTTIVAGLPPERTDAGPENPIRLFVSAHPASDGSIFSFVNISDSFDAFSSPATYTMYQITADGNTLTPLRTDSHPIWEALWAEDSSGAVIVDTEFDQRYPPTGPMRWLPADGSPALNLPANGNQARWGIPATVTTPASNPSASDFANLETLYLSDFGIELAEGGISDLYYSPFNLGDGRSLWYIHTLGFRDLANQNHSLGIYAFENGTWQQLAAYNLPGFDNPDVIPGPRHPEYWFSQSSFHRTHKRLAGRRGRHRCPWRNITRFSVRWSIVDIRSGKFQRQSRRWSDKRYQWR